MNCVILYCRLCNTKVETSAINVFTKTISRLYLNFVLNLHYNWLNIKRGDGQSDLICQECFQSTKTFHLFYLNVQDIFIKLNNQKKQINFQRTKCEDELIVNEEKKEQENDDDEFHENQSLSEVCGKDFNIVDADEFLHDDATSCDFENITESNSEKVVQCIPSQNTHEIELQIESFYNLECDICKEKCNTIRNLRQHFKHTHKINAFVKCCNKKLFNSTSLMDHVTWHTNPEAFKCKVCGKSYINSQTLKLHSHQHSPEEDKIFKCHICKKGFSMKYLLDQHLSLTHIDEQRKIYTCDHCGLKFAYQSILKNHIKSIHELGTAYICDKCGKVFKSKAMCERHHKMAHSSVDLSLTCSICSSVHKNRKCLHTHMRRMHEEAPQACDICGKVVRNKNTLQEHMRGAHILKRLHSCTFCEKSFKKPIHLREHMSTHTGAVLYTCTYCPKTFNSNANMYSHRKKMHSELWECNRRKRFDHCQQKPQYQDL